MRPGAGNRPGSIPNGTPCLPPVLVRAHRGLRKARRPSSASFTAVGHSPCWLKQYPRIHDPGGVEFGLSAAERAGEQLRHLAQVPPAMVAADGVVVGDGAAERRDRL